MGWQRCPHSLLLVVLRVSLNQFAAQMKQLPRQEVLPQVAIDGMSFLTPYLVWLIGPLACYSASKKASQPILLIPPPPNSP